MTLHWVSPGSEKSRVAFVVIGSALLGADQAAGLDLNVAMLGQHSPLEGSLFFFL